MDGGAWWAAVHGVAQSRTQPKRLSSSSSSSKINANWFTITPKQGETVTTSEGTQLLTKAQRCPLSSESPHEPSWALPFSPTSSWGSALGIRVAGSPGQLGAVHPPPFCLPLRALLGSKEGLRKQGSCGAFLLCTGSPLKTSMRATEQTPHPCLAALLPCSGSQILSLGLFLWVRLGP